MAVNLEAQIDAEIRDGLRNERQRVSDAQMQLDFYRAQFDRWTSRAPDFSRDAQRYKRVSLIMRRVIDVLTADLYRQGPTRRLPDHPEAEQWLATIYSHNGVDALMQAADQLSLAADAAALEVVPSEDPDCPIRLRVWDASQFCVWTDPNDALRVVACATIDRYDETRRLTLWTPEQIRRYETKQLLPGQTSGGTAYSLVSEDENPYGVIPFAFVHANMPVCSFWEPGPGEALCKINDALNLSLTDLGDSIRFTSKPVILAFGVGVGWRPPSVRPGDIWTPPSAELTAGGSGPDPRIEYLQAQLGYIEATWHDIDHLIEHTLEGVGVPPAAYRMAATSTKSGTALVAEQIPLARYAEARTRPFSVYEADLARVVLAVGAAHLALNGDSFGATLAEAAKSPGLVLHWADMTPKSPLTADEIAAVKADLELGITSRIRIVMDRFKLSREEAIAYLQELAEDQQIISEIGVAVEPAETKAELDEAEKLEIDDDDEQETRDGEAEEQ